MRQRDTMRRRIYCGLCSDTDWVCEDHIRTTWDACSCGGGGKPCEYGCARINPPAKVEQPDGM